MREVKARAFRDCLVSSKQSTVSEKKAGRTDPRAQDPGEGKCDPEREREPATNTGTLLASSF